MLIENAVLVIKRSGREFFRNIKKAEFIVCDADGVVEMREIDMPVTRRYDKSLIHVVCDDKSKLNGAAHKTEIYFI